MDEARRRIQELVENGLLPVEQAAFMLDVVGEPDPHLQRAHGSASTSVSSPLLEQRTSSITQVLNVAGVTRIKIDNPLGDLCVFSPSREGVEVEIDRQAAAEPEASFEELFRQIRVVDYRESGTLVLRMRAPEAPSQTRLAARVTVAVPADMDVEGVTAGALELRDIRGNGTWSADGGVRVSAYAGNLDVHTDNGDVSVERFIGDLDVHAENGNVSLRQAEGSLTVSCWRGDVSAQDVAGSLRVVVRDGDLRADGVAADLSVTATAGSVDLSRVRCREAEVRVVSGSVRVELELEGEGSATLCAENGDLVVLVPESQGGAVILAAVDGVPRCELPLQDALREAGSVRGSLGAGRARIQLEARHGDVRLGRAAPS